MSTTTHQLSRTRTDAALNLRAILLLRALLLARVAWLPLAAYVLSAAVHIGMLLVLPDQVHTWGPHAADKLTAWDGRLLLQIAQHGYPKSFTYENGALTGNNLAFMPLYPATVATVHAATGLGYGGCGILVSQLSFVVLLIAFNSLIGSMYNRRTANIAIILLACVQPMGIVFFMSYTESLFTALSMGALLALYRRHWLTAGVLTSLAGLTRPAGVATTLALAVGILAHLAWRRRFLLRPLLGLLIGCLGLPAYLLWVGLRVGAMNAWFTIQEAGWGTHWDNGQSTLQLFQNAFTRSDDWVMVSTAVMITVISTITLNAWRTSWIPLAVYGTTIVIMTFGQSNYYHSKLRLLLPVVVLVIPVALALSKAKRSTQVLCLVFGTLFSSWYSAYMLTVWHYAI